MKYILPAILILALSNRCSSQTIQESWKLIYQAEQIYRSNKNLDKAVHFFSQAFNSKWLREPWVEKLSIEEF